MRVLKFITNHPLNRDDKFRSLVRFARWQIASRLVDGEVVYRWVNGSKFLVRKGETGLTGNIYAGLHEFADMGFLLHFLRPSDLFVDVGANVGSYTILACGAIGARGYAFEPVPATYHRLMENLRLNHLEAAVSCLNIGIGRERGTIAFTSDLDTVNHALAADEVGENVVKVDVSTLDIVLNNLDPVLMKIDVEGYEAPVLEGAPNLLQTNTLRAVIMELNGSGKRYGHDETQILRTMLDYGFNTFAYDPFTRSLLDLRGKNLQSGNTLFVRDRDWVSERLHSSAPVTVHGRAF